MLKSTDEALAAFGKTIGMPRLAFAPDNTCTLDVGDSLVLELETMSDKGLIRLNAAIRELGDADFEVLHFLLVSNFNGTGTGKAALAINRASGELVLGQPVECLLHSAESFCATVDEFVRYALFWQSHAATLKPDKTEIRLADAGTDSVMMRL